MYPRISDGSRERPYFLFLHHSLESLLASHGYSEGDLVPLIGGWWRITFDRYIPIGLE